MKKITLLLILIMGLYHGQNKQNPLIHKKKIEFVNTDSWFVSKDLFRNSENISQGVLLLDNSLSLYDYNNDINDIPFSIMTDVIKFEALSYNSLKRMVYDAYVRFLNSGNGKKSVKKISVNDADNGFMVITEFENVKPSYFTVIYDQNGIFISQTK